MFLCPRAFISGSRGEESTSLAPSAEVTGMHAGCTRHQVGDSLGTIGSPAHCTHGLNQSMQPRHSPHQVSKPALPVRTLYFPKALASKSPGSRFRSRLCFIPSATPQTPVATRRGRTGAICTERALSLKRFRAFPACRVHIYRRTGALQSVQISQQIRIRLRHRALSCRCTKCHPSGAGSPCSLSVGTASQMAASCKQSSASKRMMVGFSS